MDDLIYSRPIVKLLAAPFHPDPRCEITCVSYGNQNLTMRVVGVDSAAEVVVSLVSGVRVLDEVDLTEFDDQCSLKSGWIFEVLDGGWKALELRRAHFLSARIYENLREFLIVGLNDCVSVLSRDEPRYQIFSLNQ